MDELFDISRLWHDWTTVRLIGEGSFGKVYEIVRKKFGIEEHCALKVISIPTSKAEVQSLKNDGMDSDSVTEYYQGLVQEFVQEIALMSKLKDNLNIVRYEDYSIVEHKDSVGWDIVIRMELLKDFPSYLRDNVLSETDVVRLGIDICSALEICAAHKIIHRDIKPDNIFVAEKGNFKLGDFGVARTIDKTMAGLSKKGTYTYMAPEVYKGEEYGVDADIYSLGIVMYKLLNSNREPFLPSYPQVIKYNDKNNALIRRMNGENIPVLENISKKLNDIILKACAYKSIDRYSDVSVLKTELETYFKELNVSTNTNEVNETAVVTGEDKTVSVFGGGIFDVSTTDGANSNECVLDLDVVVKGKELSTEDTESTVGIFDTMPEALPKENSIREQLTTENAESTDGVFGEFPKIATESSLDAENHENTEYENSDATVSAVIEHSEMAEVINTPNKNGIEKDKAVNTSAKPQKKPKWWIFLIVAVVIVGIASAIISVVIRNSDGLVEYNSNADGVYNNAIDDNDINNDYIPEYTDRNYNVVEEKTTINDYNNSVDAGNDYDYNNTIDAGSDYDYVPENNVEDFYIAEEDTTAFNYENSIEVIEPTQNIDSFTIDDLCSSTWQYSDGTVEYTLYFYIDGDSLICSTDICEFDSDTITAYAPEYCTFDDTLNIVYGYLGDLNLRCESGALYEIFDDGLETGWIYYPVE